MDCYRADRLAAPSSPFALFHGMIPRIGDRVAVFAVFTVLSPASIEQAANLLALALR